MKQYFFLLSTLAALHLSKAGPLRLHKRAAFYIANETACVVDNIVYSNGDPIPTDDPCEACKCRPPGFACVLKDCKVKPGCRAVRHVGHCCPEYVCGCEHNGRMYRDGEEIRDEKNPCYECHCQGSSIACAFADCLFRVDCAPVYEPGECCPSYQNCTRDTTERDSFIEGNALPPVNLLPGLNEDIFPGVFPSTEVSESTAKPTDPPQSTTEEVKYEARIPGEKAALDEVIKLEATESTVEETKTPDPETEETNTQIDKGESIDNEEKETSSEESSAKIAVEEIKVLLNSETEIKKDDDIETTTIKEATENESTVPVSSGASTGTSIQDIIKEDHLTSIANNVESVENEAKETTKIQLEIVSTSTQVSVTEKQVKNSAADNSKSLKLSEDASSEEILNNADSKEDIKVIESEKSNDDTEIVTTTSIEESSKVEPDNVKVNGATERKPELEENVAEESQTDPEIIPFYTNDKVIKKESAETVTIVVHVREKTKIPTETDFETKVTDTPTNVTEGGLIKSNELSSTETIKESTEIEDETTIENFEVSTEISKESSSASPSPDTEEKVEARSETSDSTVSIGEITPINGKYGVDTGEEVATISTTPSAKDITEVSKEARTNEEIIEGTKEEDPKRAEIAEEDPKRAEIAKEDPKRAEIAEEDPKRVEIAEEDSKSAETAKKVPEIAKNEHKVSDTEQPNVAIKIEVLTDPKEQTLAIETSKEPEKIADEDIKPEEKVEETKPEEKKEETKSEEKKEDTKSEEIAEETNPEVKEEKVKNVNAENNKKLEDDDKKSEETIEQGSQESNQPEETKDSE